MKGYDPAEAKAFMLARLEKKPFSRIEAQVPRLIEDFIQYDLHFMRLTGVINVRGEQGESEYDEDEAFEYIYDAFLSDYPHAGDGDMLVATLLNRYMELQYEFLCAKGLA